jgi:hypothetical protein
MTDDQQYGSKETERRLRKMLRGAFSGPPTPLKDIPTKSGESRATRAGGASDASEETDQPRS